MLSLPEGNPPRTGITEARNLARLLSDRCLRGWRYPPDRVADVVGNQERTGPVDRDSDRSAERLALGADKAGEHVDWVALRPAVHEGDEHHLVAAARPAVPRAVLADEGAARIGIGHPLPAREHQPERRDMVAERVIGDDGFRDHRGVRGLHAA